MNADDSTRPNPTARSPSRSAARSASARDVAAQAPVEGLGAGRSIAIWVASFIGAMPVLQVRLEHDDQSLFRIGAGLLARGAELYRDHWDVKQPGIYWFYRIAEAIGGSGPVASGVHWAFVFWLATTGLLAALVAHRATPTTQAWLLAPILTIGTYVLRADVNNFAQLEGLVALPLLGIMLCLSGFAARRTGAASTGFITGLLIGVVAVFKLLLTVPAAAMIGLALVPLLRARQPARALAVLAGALAGVAVVLAIAALPFVQAGTFAPFLWTQFVYPVAALGLAVLAPLSRLAESTLHLLATVALLVPAAWFGLRHARMQVAAAAAAADADADADADVSVSVSVGAGRATAAFDSIAASAIAWLVVGAVVVLAQRISWHAYHLMLLAWPIGLFAAIGLGAAIESVRRETSPSAIDPTTREPSRGATRSTTRDVRRLAIAAIGFATLGLAINTARFAIRQFVPIRPVVDVARYLDGVPALAQRLSQATCRTGVVFGPPALLFAANIVPFAEWTGQLAPILLPTQWAALAARIEERRPAFVYIDARHEAFLAARAPDLARWLAAHYQEIARDPVGGVWSVPVEPNEPNEPNERGAGRGCADALDATRPSSAPATRR